MKKLKYLLILVMMVFLFACENTDGNTDDDETPIPYDFGLGTPDINAYTFWNQPEHTLPIGVWADPPPADFAGMYDNPDLINDEQYNWIYEAGVNVVYGLFNNIVLNKDDVLRSLDLAEKYGIIYLVRDSQVTGSYEDDDRQLLENTISSYRDHPAFGGTMVVDEPGVVSFDNLGNLNKNYRELLPDHAFYINMLPNYASTNQLVNGAAGGAINDDSITYERYMREYITKVDPEFYSYDFYPFVGLDYGQMRSGYFDQMALVRTLSNEYEIPFWTFIQASSWSPTRLRVPNQTEIYWQVSTSIAMGAKGIQYFMYYTSMEGHGETFVGGMVDSEGNKNPMYDYVKNANDHLKNIQRVIMNSAQVGVIVHGQSPDDVSESARIDSFSILSDTSGDDMLIGAFNHQQRPAYYVVNNSLTQTEGTHELIFEDTFTMRLYESDDTRIVTTDRLELSIGAGEGVLVEILP
jgi:hypothetical protein